MAGNSQLYALLDAPDRAARSPATAVGLDVLRARYGESLRPASCVSTGSALST